MRPDRGELAAEHDGDLFGSTDADVVGHQRFEEGSGPAGVVEHQGAGHLDGAHRQLPPVAALAIGRGERGRDVGDPTVEECLHVGGSEPRADAAQGVGVDATGEAVGHGGVGDAVAVGLVFGPLVAVEPHLGRLREVGADLDEARPEVGVADVEVNMAERPPRSHEMLRRPPGAVVVC
jgi:hypothetical protein